MSRILLRRGNKVDLPALNAGEPGFATDTKELYIGTATGNQKIVSAAPTSATWIAPTLLNSWVNFGSSYANAGYYKDDLGIVHLRGLVRNGTLTAAFFDLPAGYRPIANEMFATVCRTGTTYAVTDIDVAASGSVAPNNVPYNEFVSLSGIQFRAEQ